MRLLVSVRSAEEAASAVDGGADIVDAKEPAHGSLGPVSASVLREIAAVVPHGVPLSAALGDFETPGSAREAVARVPGVGDRAPWFLKLGFRGVASERAVGGIIAAAVAAAGAQAAGAVIVPVAYADCGEAGTIAPEAVAGLARDLGAAGVLVDTWTKDGRDLLHWMPARRLRQWVALAREGGLLSALAGTVRPEALPEVLSVRPDVLGVRGAVCEGGRGGRLTARRVRRFRLAMERHSTGRQVVA